MFSLGMVGLFVVGVFVLFFSTRRRRRNRLPVPPDAYPPIAVERSRAGNGKPPVRRPPPRLRPPRLAWVSARHLFEAQKSMVAFDRLLTSHGHEPPWRTTGQFEQYTYETALLLQQAEPEWPSPNYAFAGRTGAYSHQAACDGAAALGPSAPVAIVPVRIPRRPHYNGHRKER